MIGKSTLFLNDAELNRAVKQYLVQNIFKDDKIEITSVRYDYDKNMTVVEINGTERSETNQIEESGETK